MGRAQAVITGIVGWAAGIFYEIERVGEPIPDGPVLVTANHPNSLIDALVLFRTAGRIARPLARAPLFERPVLGHILRAIGGLPVHRREDEAALMERNEQTFEKAVEALRAGDAIQIYPEGRSHSEPGLVPLRTGAARIALRAEAESDWKLGLRIVPVGLTYSRKTLFRGRVVTAVGAPFRIDSLREAYGADPAGAVRALTAEIGRRIEAVMLSTASPEDLELVDTAERLYVRGKRRADWLERQGLGERLPRLQAFARALAWLRSSDPDRYRRLHRSVRWYHRRLVLLGASEVDVPPRYSTRLVSGYALREGLLLALGAPLAALGALFWYAPYLLPRIAARRIPVAYEAIASVKLGAAMITFPIAYTAWLCLAWWYLGLVATVAAAVLLPVTGFAALAWHGRSRRVREDAGLFFRVIRNRGHRDRLAAHRAELVAEFDAILQPFLDQPAREASAFPAPTAELPG